MPERERVAGVQPAVLELVDRPQVQVAELDELAHARLVEEPVAGDDAGDVPEEPAEDDPDASHGAMATRSGTAAATRRGRVGGRDSAATPIAARTPTASQIVPCTANTTAQATKTAASAQASVRRGAALAERPRDEQPREQHDASPKASRRYSVDPCEQRVDVAGGEEARARRGTRARARRGRASARSRSDQSSSRRARSASRAPRCFARKRRMPRRFSTYSRPPCEAPPTCTTSAPGKNSTRQPARRKRYSQSVSSLNMKNASSKRPTASVASRRTSSAAPVERLDLARLVVGEAAAVERVQDAASAARACGGRGTRSRGATASGSPRTERCSVPSGFSEPRPDDRGGGMRVGEGDQPLEPVAHDPGVRVEQERSSGRRATRMPALLPPPMPMFACSIDARLGKALARRARPCRRSSRCRRRSSRGRARTRGSARATAPRSR